MSGSVKEVPSARPSGRRISWDLLRVACVLMVVLYHATQVIPDNYPTLIRRTLVFPHQIGASLLLVISAYFVCVSLGRQRTSRWWWGRLVRVMPGFLAATVIAWLALRVIAPAGGRYPGLRELAANLLKLWNWDPSWGYLDGSYWTVPMQLLAFTLAAILWRRRWGTGARLRIVLWVGVLIPMIQLPLHLAGPDWYGVIVNGLGFHRAHLFVAGAAVFLWSRRRMSGVHVAPLIAACVLGQLVHNSGFNPDGTFVTDPVAIVGVGLGMVLMLLAARGPDWTAVAPASVRPAVTWLAGISYGVYLVHQTLGMAIMRRLQEVGVGPTLQTAALVANSVLVGWLLTVLVERPAHRVLMQAFDRRAVRRSATVSAVAEDVHAYAYAYAPTATLARDVA